MFKITEFSKISQVSVKALRYYDRIGLLKPSYTGPATGYRYYTADQLQKVHQILIFKDLGFTLEQMIPLLDGRTTRGQIRSMLLHKSAEVEALLEAEKARLARIGARLSELGGEDGERVPLDVVMKRLESFPVASIREVTSKASVPRIAEELARYVKERTRQAPRPFLILWHGCAECEDSVDLEVAIPLADRIEGDGRVRVRELEGVLSTCVAHAAGLQGSYAVNERLAAWLQENGYRVPDDEPSRELYLELPDDPSAAATAELQMPIIKAAGER